MEINRYLMEGNEKKIFVILAIFILLLGHSKMVTLDKDKVDLTMGDTDLSYDCEMKV